LDEEDVPSDLIASHRWEAVLLFDNMQKQKTAPKAFGAGSQETEVRRGPKEGCNAVRPRKGWLLGAVPWVDTHGYSRSATSWLARGSREVGKGGQKVGKWNGFSHLEPALTRLFPDNST